MAKRVQSQPNRKVGEDIILRFAFSQGTAALPISAANVTITREGPGTIVVDGAAITLTSENTGEFRWTPTAAGVYLIEAHAIHGDGLDVRSANARIEIEPKLGTLMEFVGGDDAEAPIVLPYLRIPGIYTIPENAVAGQLVAITAAGVAATYASRSGTPVAAEAVILEVLSATTARLASLCVLDGLSGLTAGAPLYLGVAGAMSHTPTTTAGEIDQRVGLALTTTRALLWTVDRPSTYGLVRPTLANKAMAASVTAADFAEACATAIAATPALDGYVQVMVNGLQVELGDGVRTKDCYFSADAGATARAISAITAGDKLYWVGSVAGYQLAATDKIDFNYEAV